MLSLQNTTQQPALQSLEQSRPARKAVSWHSWTRTEKGDANDTRDTIATMAQLRAQKAAAARLSELTPPTSSTIRWLRRRRRCSNSLHRLIPRHRRQSRGRGQGRSRRMIDKSGEHFALQPVGLESLCRAGAQSQVRPRREPKCSRISSSITSLTNGLFYAANQLYGITLQRAARHSGLSSRRARLRRLRQGRLTPRH